MQLCRVLGVSRGGFYAWRKREASARATRDAELVQHIARHFEASCGIYGSPRIHALLRREGQRCGRKRVARLMREGQLRARANRIYKRQPPGSIVFTRGIENRQRNLDVNGPDQVWFSDVTFLRVRDQWRYLAVVMDKFSRRVVGWQLGRDRTIRLTMAALNQAITERRPPHGLVFHSDRGNEFAAYDFRDRLAVEGIQQSMNRPGAMGDNAHMESFFHTMKSDVIHGATFARDFDLRVAVAAYISHYNSTRLHSALGYVAPIDFERRAA